MKIDPCGIVCVILAYAIVLFVDYSFIQIGLSTELSNGDAVTIIHLCIMQIIVIFIFWTHIKCMLSDPGVLPMNKGRELEVSLLSPAAQELYEIHIQSQSEMRHNSFTNNINRSTQKLVFSENVQKFMEKVFENYCKKCESLKPPKAHHCSTC